MAEYLIQDTTLIAIADAIRAKTGGTDPIDPANMAAAIEGINGGGSDFNVSDPNLKYFACQINEETKEITICQIKYADIYAATGSYDVSIPNKIGGYNVILAG